MRCFSSDRKTVTILYLSYFTITFVMDNNNPGSSAMKSMTRNELYLLMKGSTIDDKLSFVEKEVLDTYINDDNKKARAKRTLSKFRSVFKKKWLAAHKTKAIFEKNNKKWLEGTILLPVETCEQNKSDSLPDQSGTSQGGRPQKTFTESSDRTKRRKTKDLRSKELPELVYATQMKLRECGKSDASKIVKELQKSPTRAKKYKDAYKRSSGEPQQRKLSLLETLSMIADAGLSREQYEVVRATNKAFFPCYTLVQKAKKESLPPTESYRVTETCAEIELQPLMDNTATRLLMHLEENLNDLSDDEKKSMTLISKWGCDGSQQTQFKMTFNSITDSDANIFQSSMVPLQLVCGENNKIIWQNPTPSSPRLCRPIRMRFIHETTEVTNDEISYLKSKIKNLEATKFNDSSVKHKMVFTMIDGKVCNAATHTKSTMRCYLCNATSKEFNDLTKKRPVIKKNLTFGLSLLHARIRFFENLLHIAYKLQVRKWNKKLTPEEQEIVDSTKKGIQDKFRDELGLLVDMPKANFGNTNDGNTSRRFFQEYEKSAAITGLDESLIYRLKVILDALCSGLKIDSEKFEEYALATEKLYVQLYAFYPQSPTMHKVLRHGAAVIKDAILPIGQLSEEAAEARNKHIREYRLHHSRKFSREACNFDVLSRLLLTSDPLLFGMRKRKMRKNKAYSEDVLKLLLPCDPCNDSLNLSDEEST